MESNEKQSKLRAGLDVFVENLMVNTRTCTNMEVYTCVLCHFLQTVTCTVPAKDAYMYYLISGSVCMSLVRQVLISSLCL